MAPEKYFDTDLRQYLEQDARRTIGQLQQTAGVQAPLCLGAGEVSHVVRDSALGHSADLIVIGTHGRKGIARALLGSVAENVIRTVKTPVLTIHGPRD